MAEQQQSPPSPAEWENMHLIPFTGELVANLRKLETVTSHVEDLCLAIKCIKDFYKATCDAYYRAGLCAAKAGSARKTSKDYKIHEKTTEERLAEFRSLATAQGSAGFSRSTPFAHFLPHTTGPGEEPCITSTPPGKPYRPVIPEDLGPYAQAKRANPDDPYNSPETQAVIDAVHGINQATVNYQRKLALYKKELMKSVDPATAAKLLAVLGEPVDGFPGNETRRSSDPRKQRSDSSNTVVDSPNLLQSPLEMRNLQKYLPTLPAAASLVDSTSSATPLPHHVPSPHMAGPTWAGGVAPQAPMLPQTQTQTQDGQPASRPLGGLNRQDGAHSVPADPRLRNR